MDIGTYEVALIGVGSVISGAMVGAWISYKLAIQLHDYQTKKNAGRRLVSTFHTELSEVYPYPIKWPRDISSYLDSKFTPLNAAIGEFRHFLPKSKRDSFDKKWFKYYNATGREIDNKNCQCYLHYTSFSGVSTDGEKTIHTDNTKSHKDNLKKNVDEILAYTNI